MFFSPRGMMTPTLLHVVAILELSIVGTEVPMTRAFEPKELGSSSPKTVQPIPYL